MSTVTVSVETWRNETIGSATVKALRKNGFDAVYVSDIEEAVQRVMAFIDKGKTIGFGGSMTIRALGIADRAQAVGAVILDHNAPGLTPEKKMEIFRSQLTCDVLSLAPMRLPWKDTSSMLIKTATGLPPLPSVLKNCRGGGGQ